METKFNIYSGLLKAYESDGKKRFRATASSSVRDRHGDIIRPTALRRMEQEAQGMTLFLNHNYNVPEDVMGTTDKATLFERGIDGEGNPIYDLDIEGVVLESNPRAMQAWDALNSGVKLGMSIGAMIPAEGATRDKKAGTLDITDIQLLEASIVGIPANPRSWVQYAVKSYRAAEVMETAGVERTGPVTYVVETPQTIVANSAITFIPDEDDLPVTEETGELDVETAYSCPECGGSKTGHKDGCSHAAKDAEPDMTASEPDITDATTRVTVTVNTDDPAPGTGSSGPGNASGLMDEDRADAPTEADNAALGDTATREVEPDIETSLDESDIFRALNEELLKAIRTLKVRNVELTKERDEALAKLATATEIISRIENLPLGRKTAFAAATNEFREKFGGVYDEEFLKFMEKK